MLRTQPWTLQTSEIAKTYKYRVLVRGTLHRGAPWRTLRTQGATWLLGSRWGLAMPSKSSV